MSNTQQSSQKIDKEPAKKAGSENTTKKPAAKSGLAVAVLALIISLGAFGLTGYIGWKTLALEKNQPALASGQEELQAQIARQQARLTEAVRDISPLRKALNEQQERSERLLNKTDSLSRSVNELAGTSRTGWKLAEVEYLLRLASQRLLMNADTAGAKSLLESADSILLELDDYKLYSIRAALAEDLSLINGIPDLDQEGLFLQLSALSKQVALLPLIEKKGSAFQPNPLTPATEENTSETNHWKTVSLNLLGNTWNSFVSLFRFTPDREKPVIALLSPDEDILIRHNLQLMIEQSKLALLSHNQRVYDTSLQQAIDWISDYFTLSGSSASAMISELESLKKITIQPSLSNISHALDSLKNMHEGMPSETETKTNPSTQKTSTSEPVTQPAINSATSPAITESQNNEGLFVPEQEQQQ